ncbi:hypothetical protein [Ralstonia sp. ASV6]|uniref:hypothetical protein n=1 Tax=Ralstonia sp. ASV6 TaxID=2795124 RepID=UPI0018EA54B4|nr:hypothetical protein [Ralstonia sp. ASV6]
MKQQQRMTWRVAFAACALTLISSAATAAELVLLTGIAPTTADGSVVQLRKTGPDGCTYLGAFHDTTRTASSWIEKVLSGGDQRLSDWSIELTRMQCDRMLSPIQAIVPLSKTHTYLDVDGKIRPGYAPGDSVGNMTPLQPQAR